MPQVEIEAMEFDGMGNDLNTEEALEHLEESNTSAHKNHSSPSLTHQDPEVFVTAKSYGGLLSGCIAVDKA
jgi:hypothetical protein